MSCAGIDVPSDSPPGVHVLVYLLVYLVGFLIICFICSTREKTVLVIRILELVWVIVWLFAATRLSFSVPQVSSCLMSRLTYNFTHATTSAEGPSRAGPISDRVVKPEALSRMPSELYHQAEQRMHRTLDQDQQHKKLALA